MECLKNKQSNKNMHTITASKRGQACVCFLSLLFAAVMTGCTGNKTNVPKEVYDEEESQQFRELAEEALDSYGTSTNYAEWMGEIFADKNPLISEMNIPGTHDTFTSYIRQEDIDSGLTPAFKKTQLLDIEGQWNAGVRCFDVRLANTRGSSNVPKELAERDEVGIFHTEYYCSINFDEVMSSIANLLMQHPTEACIVMLKVEKDSDLNNDFIKRIYDIVMPYESLVVHNATADIRYEDCKGKMLIFQRWTSEAPQDPDHELQLGPVMVIDSRASIESDSYTTTIFWQDGTTSKSYVQDNYEAGATHTSIEYWNDKQSYMTTYFEYAETDKSAWVFNYESGYVNHAGTTYYSMSSNVMNPWLTTYVINHIDQHYGIINMDFAGSNDVYDGYHVNGKYLPMLLVESNRFLNN